jgi:hypothetical protein
MNCLLLVIAILFQTPLLYSAEHHAEIGLLCRKTTYCDNPDIITYSQQVIPGVYLVVTGEKKVDMGQTIRITYKGHSAYTITKTDQSSHEKLLENPTDYFSMLDTRYCRIDRQRLESLYRKTTLVNHNRKAPSKKTCAKEVLDDEVQTITMYHWIKGNDSIRVQRCTLHDGTSDFYASIIRGNKLLDSKDKMWFEDLEAIYNEENS